MVDKTELLRMIMETNPSESPAAVLDKYSVYLKGLNDIHGGCCGTSLQDLEECSTKDDEAKKEGKVSLTCGFTKRSLKVKPEEAITNSSITCCLCGKTGQTLNARHLASHNGLTPEGYKKLCGYAPDQPLMSRSHFTRMKKNVLKAQEARKRSKSNKED